MDDLDMFSYAAALGSAEEALEGDPVSAPEWVRMQPTLLKWLYRHN